MPDPFAILLRNHHAGGRAAVDLFGRAAKGQRGRPYAAQLGQLLTEAREDLDFNERVMRRLNVSSSPVQVTALRLGERIGRLKPNGQLARRAPLSDVIELEGLIASVHVKMAGWQAAQVANRLEEAELAELERLISRGRTQAERLTEMHRTAAANALGRSA
ncbi:MAG TPA: hypothetical protein VEQ66_14810 [Propionibacteriaceae bacterium]|nr:hypothetical protein [Propionibacteriaceae bacterium]